ncbi:MAG: hypothetical protein J6W92_02920 [Paludibacteraceae bacterium]|nr:hypothetical protein [Paludibacteraceae bacterium]
MKAKQTMKVSAMLLVLALTLFACKESPYVSEPGDNKEAGSNQIRPLPTVDLDDISQFPNFHFPDGTLTPDIEKRQLTVKQAIAKGHEIGSGQTSSDFYYVYGYVSAIEEDENAKAISGGYGNFYFYLKDKPTDIDQFYCYQAYAGPNQKKFMSTQDLQVGNRVIIYTQLLNYGNVIETPGGKNTHGYIYSRTFREPDLQGDGTLENPYHVSDIGTVLSYISIGGVKPKEEVYIKGYVVGCVKRPAEGEPAEAEQAHYVSPFTSAENLLLAESVSETVAYNFGELVYFNIDETNDPETDVICLAMNIKDFTEKKDKDTGEITYKPYSLTGTYAEQIKNHEILVKCNLTELYGMPAIDHVTYIKLPDGTEITR